MIKTILCEVANAAIKTKSQFKGKYQSLVIRRGHKRSLVAIAHKLIRVIYNLLKLRQPYIDPDTDYEGLMVRKNAARWLNKLVDYGYLAQAQQSRQRTQRRAFLFLCVLCAFVVPMQDLQHLSTNRQHHSASAERKKRAIYHHEEPLNVYPKWVA